MPDLDLSNSACLLVDDTAVGQDKSFDKLITPKEAHSIDLKTVRVGSLYILGIRYLRSISIEHCPKNIFCTMIQGKKIDFIDFTPFRNLLVVVLKNVENNVFLPSQLDKLVLSQGVDEDDNVIDDSQVFRILNQKISSKDITIRNFDLTGIVIEECESIYLMDTKVDGDILDLSEVKNLKSVTLNNVENNVLLPSQLDKLFLYQEWKNHRILNQYISSKNITIKNFDLTGVVLKDFESIYLSYTKVDGDILDLSEVRNLKSVTLNNVKNSVLLPSQLDKLDLQQSGSNHRILNQYISSKKVVSVHRIFCESGN